MGSARCAANVSEEGAEAYPKKKFSNVQHATAALLVAVEPAAAASETCCSKNRD
jgi:hypothetical protein